MSIEAMKQAAEKALVVLGSATSFMSRKARDQHESVVAELRTAIQQAEAKTDEPVAYMWQHDETGRTGFVEPDQLAMGWRDANPRLNIVAPCYTHPAPGVPDDVVRGAISTVREQYRGTDWGKAAECICDAIDAAMLAASPAPRSHHQDMS